MVPAHPPREGLQSLELLAKGTAVTVLCWLWGAGTSPLSPPCSTSTVMLWCLGTPTCKRILRPLGTVSHVARSSQSQQAANPATANQFRARLQVPRPEFVQNNDRAGAGPGWQGPAAWTRQRSSSLVRGGGEALPRAHAPHPAAPLPGREAHVAFGPKVFSIIVKAVSNLIVGSSR